MLNIFYKLSVKITIAIIVAVTVSVGLNGIYFDSFLKEQYFQDVTHKTISAKKKLVDEVTNFKALTKACDNYRHEM